MSKILSSFKEVALVYRSDSNVSNVVYFAIKGSLSKQEIEGSECILVKDKMKISQKNEPEWTEEELKSIELIYTVNG